MNEIAIRCNLESPQEKNKKVTISVVDKPEEKLFFKYMVGCDGTWETIKDFSDVGKVEWTPKEDGKYIIMVQAKKEGSAKPYDYVSRIDYIIGRVEEKLINDIYIDKKTFTVGERLAVTVETNKVPVMLRYWIKEGDSWELVKDYSADNTLVWSLKNSGKQEILVECKSLDSKNNFDDFKKAGFEVLPIKKLEITDFKCLSSDLLTESELIFQVDAVHEDNRMILYKFIKINSMGSAKCIQDYSTKRMVSYTEKNSGSYKLMCMAKDMYSPKEYDDRAIINYIVKPYKDIFIKSFTCDLSSPQICETAVELKAIVKGGRELLYRFIIDGNYGEDSGYIRQNTYLWKTKKAGRYKINLWIKDTSFDGNYEAASIMDFTVDEQSTEPVQINEVVLDKGNKLLKNETVNIKIMAAGGMDLRYSFCVRMKGEIVEKINYGTCNWANFTPKKGGNYELEALVRDKFSKRDFDSHSVIYFDAYDYIPANIDYVLLPAKEYYITGDTVTLNIIAQNTRNTLIKYVLKINGHKVEETEYVHDKKYIFEPKCSGIYEVEMYAKNKDSDKEFDCKRVMKVRVSEALPVTNTKIGCEKTRISINDTASFTVHCEGGKDVMYEFYLLEKGDWNLVQKYSRKDNYSFMAFVPGNYKILTLCRSEYKNVSYEDYDIMEFTVE